MHLCKLKSLLLLITFQFGVVSFLIAQQYLFIEAEGQQPFYLKRGGETLSSSGSGFIILSKLNQREIDVVIGFPNKIYPEVAFKIGPIQQDRGFALRQLEGKGWVLVDRQTSSLVLGGPVDIKTTAVAATSSSTGFANMLSDATGDKSLLEKTALITTPSEKPLTANAKTKSNTAQAKLPTPAKQASKAPALGIVRSYIQIDDSSLLRIAYFEKGAKNSWDTIIVEIEKKRKQPYITKPVAIDSTNEALSSKSSISNETIIDVPKQNVATELSVGCSLSIALPKDLRELQRKMAKAASFELQLDLATKAFNEKCYTTKQVKELGTIFWEEQNKLTFYSRIKKQVADPSLYGELEQTFIQEASKKAFRDMLKKEQL
jgi:hypothetical protein